MTKVLLVLFVLVGAPMNIPYSPTVPPSQNDYYAWDSGTDRAAMCHVFKDGADCQEALADDVDEVCWCKLVDNSWVYCGCLQPSLMSQDEYLEYLMYRGKPDEVQI